MKFFLSPHNDDEALFGAFTILRERPTVVICYDSAEAKAAYGDPAQRLDESVGAIACLNATGFSQLSARPGDEMDLWDMLLQFQKAEHVWAPDPNCSHSDHAMLAKVAADLFRGRLTTYHTYNDEGKVVSSRRVAIEQPWWIGLKLKALACYTSQFRTPAHKFFLNDLHEYYGPKR